MQEKRRLLRKVKRQVKGITLVALVVTIIVLLILAGVAINLTIGQNGIFRRAQDATNKYEQASLNEQAEMNKVANIIGEYMNGNGGNSQKEPIDELEGNIIYADFEGDGVADGIIFADLAVGNRGDGNWRNDWGDYIIPQETGLKEYYVVNESYTEPKFGNLTGQLIAPIDRNSSEKDRFYVMALEDIDSERHTWWANAYRHLDSTYSIDNTTNDFAVAGAEPTGLVNTRRMMECYENEEINGTEVKKGTNDMWGLIEEEVAEGWFVPSKSEWAAFGGEVLELNNITPNDYGNYGLSSWCWSSSQLYTNIAYTARFDNGYMLYNYVTSDYFVRLTTTF